MLSAFTLGLAVIFFPFFQIGSGQSRNETSQNKSDHDFVDSRPAVAGNFTASISVSDADIDDRVSNFEKAEGNVSITDRSGNQELLPNQNPPNPTDINPVKNITSEAIKLEDFRPSPQLETYFEFNKFPVKPAMPESKMVRNFASVNTDEKDYAIKGEVLPLEHERSRNLNNFEPGYSAFGNGVSFPQSVRAQNELPRDTGGTYNNNEPPWITQQNSNEVNRKNTNGEAPWVSRVRFPPSANLNESPYPYVSHSGSDQNCCSGKPGPNYNLNTNKVGYVPPPPNYGLPPNYDLPGPNKELYPQPNNYNNKAPPPLRTNDYLPPVEGVNRYPPSTNNLDSAKNYNNINTNKVGYLPPPPNYGFTEGGNIAPKNEYLPPSYDLSGPNKEFNFNKLVEVPKTYYSEPPNQYPQHSYEPSYNIMEKPSSDGQHKTFGGGMSYNPWKKILKLFATFIPIGLLISALTPTVISVTNVNDTNDMATTRYRSNEESKKEVTNHVLSSLDYFEKLNENGCEYRVFCELLVSASHMPNSKQHVENLLDNFAKEEIDYKSRAEELRKVFAAVRNHDCNSISCEFIKNPT